MVAIALALCNSKSLRFEIAGIPTSKGANSSDGSVVLGVDALVIDGTQVSQWAPDHLKMVFFSTQCCLDGACGIAVESGKKKAHKLLTHKQHDKLFEKAVNHINF